MLGPALALFRRLRAALASPSPPPGDAWVDEFGNPWLDELGNPWISEL